MRIDQRTGISGITDIDYDSSHLIVSKLACNRMAPLHLPSLVCDTDDDFAVTSTKTSGTVSKMATELKASKGFGEVSGLFQI